MFRKILLKLIAKESPLVGNFSVYRALPRRELRRVGGFVFFDHFDAENITPGQFDIPPHPHVGLQTVTYLFEGEILHTDSLGFQEIITDGAVNWMTAGKGITHAEQVLKIQPRMHGIQSWVGLPHVHVVRRSHIPQLLSENGRNPHRTSVTPLRLCLVHH